MGNNESNGCIEDHYRDLLRNARIRQEYDSEDSDFARTVQAVSAMEKSLPRPTPGQRLAFPLALVLIPCLLLGLNLAAKGNPKENAAYAMLKQRATDLANLHNAIESFRNDRGHYPPSHGFAGLYAKTGDRVPDWIEGLVPKYLPRLPHDPREDRDPNHQYLYNSNGRDYKIIAHHPDDCELAKATIPERIDPLRGCLAYGYWSGGAKNW